MGAVALLSWTAPRDGPGKRTDMTLHRAIRLMEALAETVAAQQAAKPSRIRERRLRRRRIAR